MGLVGLIVTIAVVGLALWLVNAYVPMPAPVKTVLNVVVALVLLVWALRALGVA